MVDYSALRASSEYRTDSCLSLAEQIQCIRVITLKVWSGNEELGAVFRGKTRKGSSLFSYPQP